MHIPKIYKNNIQNFLNKEEIVFETIQQVMKDFVMFGLKISFLGNIKNAYTEIHSQIVNQVEVLFNSDISKLYSILYQVDIRGLLLIHSYQNFQSFS